VAVDAGIPRLDLLKALGDNTRYAIYLELARSPKPLATADIADSLDLHPNTVRPHLERMREVGLLEVSAEVRTAAGATSDDAADVGRDQGNVDARAYTSAASCLEALVDRLDRLGFDPAVDGSEEGETAVIAFAHCPFRELAEAHPDLVCSLHRGMVEGFVETMGDADVLDFHPLAHRQPCQVSISSR
jgi:predicted ArsR family transcriptional regulator